MNNWMIIKKHGAKKKKQTMARTPINYAWPPQSIVGACAKQNST